MARSGRTVTGTLVALVLALTLPVTAFTAFVLVRYAMEEQSRYAREAEQIAGFVGEIVDRELTNFASVLKGASTSSELLSGNLSGFYDEAVRLVAGTDNIVLLRDMGQRQLINTAQPFGAALPPAVPLTESERAALEADHPVVGGVYASPLSGELRIPVAIPVSLNNEPLVLAITVPAAHFWRVITPAAPPGWVITIGDGNGIIVGRSLDNETYAGQPALPEYLALASGDGGSFRITGFGGSVLLSGYSRSPFSNWIIGANIPINVVEAPLWSSLAGILAVALAAAVIAMVISAAFIRRFRRASLTLLDQARNTQASGPPPDTGLQEFDQIIDALADARAHSDAAERSLRERTQELEILLETVPASVWFTYDPAVLEVKRNAHAGRLLRLPLDSRASIGSGAFKHLHTFKDGEPCPASGLPLQRAFRGENVRDEEYEYRFDEGGEVTLLTSAEALRDPFGTIIGAVSVSVDITERKRNDERQKLLINELNHRVKNTLTTVQSIARRTLRTAGSLAEAESALAERLVAVARAYDVLTREHWKGSSVAAVLASAIGGYSHAGRVTFDGPDFWLSPSSSVTFSLIVHELAVNATKHGALSDDHGRVDIGWTVGEDAEGAVLTLHWRESGGPAVKPPERNGFGTDLLRRLTQTGGAEHHIDFEPAGVVCTVSLRQSRRPEDDAPVDGAALPS